MAPPLQQRNPFAQSRAGSARLQYAPYSIFINGSDLVSNFADLRRAVGPLLPEKADEWMRRRLRLLDDNPPADERPAVKTYERDVGVTLNALRDAEIGKCLFKSLNPEHPVWIVPYVGEYCNAITTYRSSDWTRGVSLRFSPSIYDVSGCGRIPGYRRDETLFHEMVHASRKTRLSFDEEYNASLELMKDGEEFLAVMLSNSYRSERGAKKFNYNYLTSKLGSQAEVEQTLSSKREYIEAIKYFLDDPLVKLVVKLPMPFNVFRDFARLEAAYQKSPAARVDHLRDQFTPFSHLVHTE